MNEHEHEKRQRVQSCIIRFLVAIVHIWGIITMTVLWVVVVFILKDPVKRTFYVGWYLLAVGVIVTVFEVIVILNLSPCCGPRGCCSCKCWKVFLWVDNWKKGILYILLSVPVFFEKMRILLSIICGLVLLVCACLYIVKSFDQSLKSQESRTTYYIQTKSPKVKLVSHEIGTQTDDDKYYSALYGSTN